MKTRVTLSTFLAIFLCFIVNTNAKSATDPYTLIWYPELLERTVELSKHPHLFKVENIFEKYPDITKVMCGEDECISPLIEMTNFENSPEYIKSLPTLFILAGIHGNEVIGTNAIYRFFDMILKYKTTDPFYFWMLNNLRVVFLPLANPSGFYRKIREEVHIIENREIKIDPNRDFDWDNSDGCYVTCSSQSIGHIFKDNLIVGTLTYHGGESSITYPWGTYVHRGHSRSKDHVAFSNIATMLRDSAGVAPQYNLNPFVVGTMEDIVYDVHGGYEDWAYGASAESKFITQSCLNPDTIYNENFLKTDDNSNRAFVYLIEAGEQKTPDEGTLGNEQFAIDKTGKGAENGNVTRSILILKQYFEVMRPFPMILKINKFNASHQSGTNTSNSNPSSKPGLMIEFDVRGCKTVDSITLIHPKSKSQNFEVEEPTFDRGTQSNLATLQVTFDDNSELLNWAVDLVIDIKCDSDWAQSKNENGQTVQTNPDSHFLRGRLNNEYERTSKGFTFKSGNLHEFKITNFIYNKINESVMFHKLYNEVEMMYHSQLELEHKGKPVLKMDYDKTENIATLKVEDSSINLSSMSSSTHSISENISTSQNETQNEIKSNKRILSQNNKDYIVKFYQETNFPHEKIEGHLVNTHILKKSKTKLSDYNAFDSKLPAVEPYFTIPLNSSIEIHPLFYMNLVGKKFSIYKSGSKNDEKPILSGVVSIKTEKNSVSPTLLNGVGMSIPSEGAWCSSIDQSNLKNKEKDEQNVEFLTHVEWMNNKKVKIYFIVSKDQNLEMVSMNSLNIQKTLIKSENWKPSKKLIKKINRDIKKTELTADEIKQKFSLFEGNIERKKFMVMGSKIDFFKDIVHKNPLASCVLERGSNFSEAASLGEMYQEMIERYNSQLGKNLSHKENISVNKTEFWTMRLMIIALILGVLTLTIFLCVICRKKVANFNEDEREGMEIGEIQRANDADHPYFNN